MPEAREARKRSLAADFSSGIALYATPIVLRLAISLIAIPVYTRHLSPEGYGIMELLDVTSFLFAMVVGSNFAPSLFYFYSNAEGEKEKGESISTAFFGALILGGLGSALAVVMAPALSNALFGTAEYSNFLRLALVTIGLSLPAEVALCCARVLDWRLTYTAVSIVRLLAGFVLTLVLLVGFGWGVAAFLWSSFLVTLGTALYGTWMCRSWLTQFAFRSPVFVAIFKYSLPVNLSSIAMMTMDMGDRYVLKQYVSLADIGVYGLAYKIGMMVTMASIAFNQFWKPRMFSLVKQPGGEQIYANVYAYYVIGLSLVTVALTAVSGTVFDLIVGRGFGEAAQYIPWIALAYTIRGSGDFARNAFFLAKRTVKDAQVTWIGTAVCLAGYLVFIPRLRLWGAIAATMLSFVIMLVISLWQAQRLMPFPIEWRRLAVVAVCCPMVMAAFLTLQPSDTGGQIAAAAACLLGYVVLLAVAGAVPARDRRALGAALGERLGIRPAAGGARVG